MTVGVWFVGGRGSVAVTAIVGGISLRHGFAAATGCVTELPDLQSSALPAFADMVFGGHDISTVPLAKKAEALAASGVIPTRLVTAVAEDLVATDAEVRPVPSRATQADTVAAMVDDITSFRRRHALDGVVVVNVSSTEPAAVPHPAHVDLDALEIALSAPGTVLPPSSLAAYAALTAGCPFVDFTPSTGIRLPALAQLALRQGLPFAGNDGKTGETLVKSVLAPMFAMRNLRVNTWSGINFLGGGDGATLADPAAKAAKAVSKQRVLGETLGYAPQGHSVIEYVEDIGDFKTAWDLITFTGFLGTQMRMEFTWHGCDSALAAPLVLDLARLTWAAHGNGRTGALTELGFFFKDPIGQVPHALSEQWAELRGLVRSFDSATKSDSATEVNTGR